MECPPVPPLRDRAVALAKVDPRPGADVCCKTHIFIFLNFMA